MKKRRNFIMKLKKLVTGSLLVAASILFVACDQLDVVAKIAVTSFEALLNKMQNQIAFDEAEGRWVLIAPTGEKFEWSKDFSTSQSDIKFEFEATPFIQAGLDVEKLEASQYVYDEEAGKIRMPFELSEDQFSYSKEATPLDTFRQIVKTNRKSIGYHEDLGHFGISLGEGNTFEWAKDMSQNDKDIVFVLNPQPFIDAGVDPSKIEGWVFGKVKIMDDKGKEIEVDKLLKPFELN